MITPQEYLNLMKLAGEIGKMMEHLNQEEVTTLLDILEGIPFRAAENPQSK